MTVSSQGLEARGLVREFTTKDGSVRRAVDDVTLVVRPGELVSVLGPNGAGKTTTVKMLTGLLLPTAGQVLIDGHDVVRDRRRAALACGFSLGGDTGLYPRLTAAQNLEFFGLMYGLRGSRLAGRTRELLAEVDLADRSGDLVGSFSRGMKQRLHLARALLHEPSVLILDEPSAGLDPQSAATMRALVARLTGEGRSILLTTHDMREAEELSRRIVLMKDGRVHVESTAGELRLNAANRLGHVVNAVFSAAEAPEGVRDCPGALRVERDGSAVTLRVTDGAAAVQWLLAAFPGQTTSVAVTPPTLEEVFLDMVAAS
ncbi:MULTISPECIES: ABC transporter ATP-binding protein [Streptomyces]|uniref:ABC-2 type transport system ATP-binding protein n=1 Tax=Streptomyces misionensis TaxID=67331 RepID=A0A1H4VBT3_9ACTN|nr:MULTISPECIES: ABC transporter ATP-binding protein [Streptomyces]SEC78058.1 ABC-2 type transport system ATP-binding protein [Streptomyces misionensis]SFY51870.1 ABC transporter ATP-binding protein NatA [Streptomyces sp. F-1]